MLFFYFYINRKFYFACILVEGLYSLFFPSTLGKDFKVFDFLQKICWINPYFGLLLCVTSITHNNFFNKLERSIVAVVLKF